MSKSDFITNKQVTLLAGLALSVLLLIIDFYSGPMIQFPATYLIPVAIVSWFNGRRWGLALAILMPLVRLLYHASFWDAPWTLGEAATNAVIRIAVIATFAILIDRNAIQSRLLAHEVDMLEGLLPICSFCKKIRDKDNQWQVLEKYIGDRSQVTWTHGVCPDCMREHYGDIKA